MSLIIHAFVRYSDINAALKHELTCYECIEMAKVEQKMKITYYCLVALCMSSFCMFVMCILHPQYVEGFFQQYVDPVFYKIKHIILDLLLTPIN